MPPLPPLAPITIEKLISGGSALAHTPDGKAIIIVGGGIPGSIVSLRVLKTRTSHIEAQILDVLTPSPHEISLKKGQEMHGGCKWLTIPYPLQLQWKSDIIRESASLLHLLDIDTILRPIVPSPLTEGYRNKTEYSWGNYISLAENRSDEFCFGFHKQGDFRKVVDSESFVLADAETNALFRDIKILSRDSGYPVYDPIRHEGFWRHLVVRRSQTLNETMITWSVNPKFFSDPLDWARAREMILSWIPALTASHPSLVSIHILSNIGKADVIHGNLEHVGGKTSIEESLLGMKFEIGPKSFFQTNTSGAEKLYEVTLADIPKAKIGLDLYGGTATIGCLMARHCDTVYSVETNTESSAMAEKNAIKNNISNLIVRNESAESFVAWFVAEGLAADVIVVDPPRAGIEPKALETLLQIPTREIRYVSCNPATLMRDLQTILATNEHRLVSLTPVDMFPHTHHIECVARIERV